MLFKKENPAKKEIEALFHEIQINLENNYKDLAIAARKQAEAGDPGDANALTPNYLRLSQAERERAERMKAN